MECDEKDYIKKD